MHIILPPFLSASEVQCTVQISLGFREFLQGRNGQFSEIEVFVYSKLFGAVHDSNS